MTNPKTLPFKCGATGLSQLLRHLSIGIEAYFEEMIHIAERPHRLGTGSFRNYPHYQDRSCENDFKYVASDLRYIIVTIYLHKLIVLDEYLNP